MERQIVADQRRFSNYKKEHLVPLYERELHRKAIPAGRRRPRFRVVPYRPRRRRGARP
jgi:hypothetical protein